MRVDRTEHRSAWRGQAASGHGGPTGGFEGPGRAPLLRGRRVRGATLQPVVLGLGGLFLALVLLRGAAGSSEGRAHPTPVDLSRVDPRAEAHQEKIDHAARFIRREAIEHVLGPPAFLGHGDNGDVYATYYLGWDGLVRHVYRDGSSIGFFVHSDARPTLRLGEFRIRLNQDSFEDVLPGKRYWRGANEPASSLLEPRGWYAWQSAKGAYYGEWEYGGYRSSYTTLFLHASDWSFAQLDPMFADGRWKPAPPVEDEAACWARLRTDVRVQGVGALRGITPTGEWVEFLVSGRHG